MIDKAFFAPPGGGGGGRWRVVPYIDYISMCGAKGYVSLAVLV